MKVLILDSEPSARRLLQLLLSEANDLSVLEAASDEEARPIVLSQNPALLLIGVGLPNDLGEGGGLPFLRWARQVGSQASAVMVASSTDLGEIREAMRYGAHDYILREELCPEMLLPIVESVRERIQMQREARGSKPALETQWGTRALVGSSPSMQRVRYLIERVAAAEAPVLIRGKTGSGKELAARAIHQLSARAPHPFVAVNCSALPGTLIESMIFGHHRGAFTGADRRVRGQLELAGEGTLVLDEIAEMPVELQAKLLRVLEDRRFRPLGSEVELPLRARILAATHVDLEERMATGHFREDLFYRLNVVTLSLPSLAERRQDIPELVSAFNDNLLTPLSLSSDAVRWLEQREWPGNVRELKNALERVALLCEGPEVTARDLAELVGDPAGRALPNLERFVSLVLTLPRDQGSKLDFVERVLLKQALDMCNGNKSAAARLVGVDRKALERRWERLSEPPGPPEPGGRVE